MTSFMWSLILIAFASALGLSGFDAHAQSSPAPEVPLPPRRAPTAFPPRPQAQIVRDPQNESLCSIIGGDQFGRPIRNNGIRAIDLQLFAETDPDNARLAALYRRTARPVRVNDRETRLIGYGNCTEMQTMVDAMNFTYYNIPELRCSGADNQLYRVRRLGPKFKIDIMALDPKGRSINILERRHLEITNTSRHDNGCLYRLTAPQQANAEQEKDFDLKICLADFSTRPAAKLQKVISGQYLKYVLKCEADPGFSEHANPLVHLQLPYGAGQPPSLGPQQPAPTYQ